jgi:hypothetical protein
MRQGDAGKMTSGNGSTGAKRLQAENSADRLEANDVNVAEIVENSGVLIRQKRDVMGEVLHEMVDCDFFKRSNLQRLSLARAIQAKHIGG